MSTWERFVEQLTNSEKAEFYCAGTYCGECKFYHDDDCKYQVEQWLDQEEDTNENNN